MISPAGSATTSDSGVASRKEPGVRTSERRPRAASKSEAGSRRLAILTSSAARCGHLRCRGRLRRRDTRAAHRPPVPTLAPALERGQETLDGHDLVETQELHQGSREEDEAV